MTWSKASSTSCISSNCAKHHRASPVKKKGRGIDVAVHGLKCCPPAVAAQILASSLEKHWVRAQVLVPCLHLGDLDETPGFNLAYIAIW